MKTSVRKGFSFGLTSGIITTLGLIVGLESGTNSAMVVISGIIVIAIADALSDSLGMHISEESENHHSPREIWESTAATFFSKFFFALSFVVPFLIMPLSQAIIIGIAWGLSLIVIFSYHMSRQEHSRPFRVVTEHLAIAVLVIVASHFVGDWVSAAFWLV